MGFSSIGRHHRGDDLRVLLVALGEERPQRAIHQATGQDLVVALARFALEEAAGDLARGVGLLDVLAGEREEVEARSLFGRGSGHEHHALAVGHEDRAVRELGETSRFEGELAATDGDGFTYVHS